jgi:Xaa-Pro aminopeptidase
MSVSNLTEELPLTEAQIERRALVAEKHEQAKTLLKKQGIDCWLTFSREGSDLLLPYVMGGEYLVGQAALMIFAEGPTVAIVADYDISQVEGEFDIIHAYHGDWKEPFLETLKERNPATIAANYSEGDFGVDGLTHGLYLKLTDVLDSLGMKDRLRSAESITTLVRAIKTPGEVERIRRACAVTQRIFEDVTGLVRPGMTEMEVHEFINERMQTYGVTPSWEAAYCPAVMTSRRPAGHTPPTADKIRAGDGLQIDFGVFYEGYGSDLQRFWYFKKPGESGVDPKLQHAFDTMRDAIRLASELIKPGVRGYEVDEPVRNYVAEQGYTYFHATGHQIGRMAHDGGLTLGPRNVRYGDRVMGELLPGMCFTLEPCIFDMGLEENLVVTEDGCDWLIAPQTEIYVL